jgi:hypothetical protein
MKTMLRILEMAFAWTSCSTISPAVRLPLSPIVPVQLRQTTHRVLVKIRWKLVQYQRSSASNTYGKEFNKAIKIIELLRQELQNGNLMKFALRVPTPTEEHEQGPNPHCMRTVQADCLPCLPQASIHCQKGMAFMSSSMCLTSIVKTSQPQKYFRATFLITFCHPSLPADLANTDDL